MTKPKYKTLRIVAEISIPIDAICEEHTLTEDLVGEVVFVKSGIYENIATGNIVSIK